MPSAKRASITAFAIAVPLAIGAYWYWSPYVTIKAMQSAAKAKDAQAFNQYVDYPVLRQNVKAQINAQFKKSDGAGATLAGLLGNKLTDMAIDAIIRPETVMKGMSRASMQRPATPQAAVATNKRDPQWHLVREGINQVVIVNGESSEKQAPKGFVFERSGFATWTLTNIRLLDSPPASPPP